MALKDSVLNIVLKAKDLASGTFNRFKNSLNQTTEAANRTESRLARLAKRVLALGTAFIGIQGIGRLGADILRTGDQFEKMGLQLEAITGSSQAAEAAMSWIEDFTKNTPLQVSQVTEQFTRLKAFGLDPMDGTLQSLVDQNEKLGGGYKRLNGIVNAFGQAWAKQKLQGEEILQLIERGVPVWDRLSKVTGKSTAELQKMSTAGKLGRDVIKELYL